MEHFPYGKQIGEILDLKNRQTRPQAQKPIFLGLESEKYGNSVSNFDLLCEISQICSRNFCAEWL